MSELNKLSRFAVAIGGLLLFTGCVMVVVSALAFFDVLHVSTGSEWKELPVWVLLVVSVLNLISGILLVRRWRG